MVSTAVFSFRSKFDNFIYCGQTSFVLVKNSASYCSPFSRCVLILVCAFPSGEDVSKLEGGGDLDGQEGEVFEISP